MIETSDTGKILCPPESQNCEGKPVPLILRFAKFYIPQSVLVKEVKF